VSHRELLHAAVSVMPAVSHCKLLHAAVPVMPAVSHCELLHAAGMGLVVTLGRQDDEVDGVSQQT